MEQYGIAKWIKKDTDVNELSEQPSVIDMIKSSIESCDQKFHNQLWSHIIVTGGTSLLTGFKERLTNELSQINKESQIIFANDPIISSWKGAVYAAKNEPEESWLSFAEFDKDPTIVFSKFTK